MFQDSYMRRIASVFGILAIIALGAYTYATLKSAKYMYSGPITISVVGTGEVSAKPDIATFSFTVQSKEADANTAQAKAAETVTKILAFLKEKGVDDKDVKTQYFDLSPWYEQQEYAPCTQWGCPPQPYREPKIAGYQVNETVVVKVRKTEDAGTLIGAVGEFGAQNISGLTFTIDDEKKLKVDAREKAIEDAKVQAEKLAKQLGVRIVRMSGYWEDEGYGYPIEGYGGMGFASKDAMNGESAPVAEVPQGEHTITARVNISYEIK
jgi:uncharacterized protein YggE